MRQQVIDELTQRINELRKIAKPWDTAYGMTGSWISFAVAIQMHTAMTPEEWDNDVYNDWVREQHHQMMAEINKDIPDPFLV